MPIGVYDHPPSDPSIRSIEIAQPGDPAYELEAERQGIKLLELGTAAQDRLHALLSRLVG